MNRINACLGLVAALTLASCGGGGSSTGLASFFPADDEVSGWTRSPAGSEPQVAENADEAEALVDGDIAPFEAAPSPFLAFAMQDYTDGTYLNRVRIWEVADAAGCASTYDYLVTDVSTFSSKTWSDESIGDRGRSASGAAWWWFNACADKYFIEAKVEPIAGGSPDQTSYDLGLAFIQAMAAGM